MTRYCVNVIRLVVPDNVSRGCGFFFPVLKCKNGAKLSKGDVTSCSWFRKVTKLVVPCGRKISVKITDVPEGAKPFSLRGSSQFMSC